MLFAGIYDTVSNSVEPGCGNQVIVDCATNPIEGIPCPASGVWKNGCLADINPIFGLTPSTGASYWHASLREGFEKPDPEWYKGAGVDGNVWFSNTTMTIFSFNVLF